MASDGKDKSPSEVLILKAVSDLGTRFDKVENGLKKIDETVLAHGQRLVVVSSAVDSLDQKIRSLEIENEGLKSEMIKLKNKESLLEEKLNGIQLKVDITYQKTNDVEQYTRRENLRVYGVKEKEFDNNGQIIAETAEQCAQKVLSILNTKLKLNRKINSVDLAAVHRIGKFDKKNPKARSIIIRFVSRKVRDMVFEAKSGLKDSGYVIAEDLTPYQFKLLMKTKNDDSICDKAWTKYGKVMMLTQSGKYVQINSFSDLTDPLNRSRWSQIPSRKRDFDDVMKSPEQMSNSPEYRHHSDAIIDQDLNEKTKVREDDKIESVQAEEVGKTSDLTFSKTPAMTHSKVAGSQDDKIIQNKIQVDKSNSLLDLVNISEIESPRRFKRARSKIPGRFRGGGDRGKIRSRPVRSGLFNYFMSLESDVNSEDSEDAKMD